MANLKFKRGTKGTVTFTLKGNHTERELSFVVKSGEDFVSKRLIEKLKSLGEISTTYDEETDLTTCEVSLEVINTQSLAIQSYPWDVDSISLTDVEDVTTPNGGSLQFLQDVQTPFDGFEIPEENIIYQAVSAEDGGVGDIVMINASGKVEFTPLAQLKTLLDELS